MNDIGRRYAIILAILLSAAIHFLISTPRFTSSLALIGFSSLALARAGSAAMNRQEKDESIVPLLLLSSLTLLLAIVNSSIGRTSVQGVLSLGCALAWYVVIVISARNFSTAAGTELLNVRAGMAIGGLFVVFVSSIAPIVILMRRWRWGVTEPARSPADIALYMMAATGILFAYLSIRARPSALRLASPIYPISAAAIAAFTLLFETMTMKEYRVTILICICLFSAWLGVAISRPTITLLPQWSGRTTATGAPR